jgi:phosphoribosyl-AMP cyclohydrolase
VDRESGIAGAKAEEMPDGHVQQVREVLVDCDADTVLLKVEQQGAACHEGYRSCFFREINQDETKIVEPRLVDPKKVYQK